MLHQRGFRRLTKIHEVRYSSGCMVCIFSMRVIQAIIIKKVKFIAIVRHLILSFQPFALCSSQQLFYITQSRRFGLPSLVVFLLESHHHELTLFGLNIQCTFLDAAFHDETEDTGLLRLSQAVNTVDGLIFDGRSPPTVRENDLIGSNEVQTDTAHTQARQHDRAIRVVLEGMQSLVSKSSRHGAIKSAVLEAFTVKSRLHNIEELGLPQLESATAR